MPSGKRMQTGTQTVGRDRHLGGGGNTCRGGGLRAEVWAWMESRRARCVHSSLSDRGCTGACQVRR